VEPLMKVGTKDFTYMKGVSPAVRVFPIFPCILNARHLQELLSPPLFLSFFYLSSIFQSLSPSFLVFFILAWVKFEQMCISFFFFFLLHNFSISTAGLCIASSLT
jgi:hypothetical protein